MLFDMGLRKNPDQLVSRSLEKLAEPDRRLLGQPDVAKVYVEMLREAFLSGIGGVYHDAGLYTRPWGFLLQDIAVEVYLWHGELDINVPISVGRYVADAIPDCRAKFLPNEAHLSLAHNHIEEILSILI